MKKVLSIWSVLTVLGLIYLVGWIQPEPVPEWKNLEIVETIPTTPNIAKLAGTKVRYTAHWDEDVSDNTVQISYQDAQLLMMVASAEGGNQGKQGMLKIMQVIMNRVNSDKFPNSVYEVVFQTGQFESVMRGSIYTVQITPECREALAELEKNLNADNKIIGFETVDNDQSLLKYFDYSFREGDHVFYQLKKN